MHQRESETVPNGWLSNGNPIKEPTSIYTVPKLTLFDPANRPLKAITIGAGVSGILTAYKIQKHLQNIELKVYERNADIGGTWLLNKYPGCACDIPSHAYTYSFALNPDWPSFFSPAKDIWNYLDRVCKTWNLRKYMTFSTEVLSCHWQEETSKWKVNLRTLASDGTRTDFSDECDVLLHATGVLDKFKWPKIEGLDKFKGKLVHTARWPDEYQAEAWKSEKVAIIGSGASSIQTVPNMQPYVKHMSIFMRTPVWFVEIAGNDGKNIAYTPDQKDDFQHNPASLVAHAKSLEDQVNSGWAMMIKGSDVQKAAQEHFRKRTAGIVKDSEIADKITPKFSVGCRRITPGDPYLQAIQQPNVKVVFEEAVKITENSIIGKDGTEVKDIDTIVCATGFDTSFRPAFPIVGRNGVDLREKWAKRPEGYLGLTAPDIPK
jgi:hydroxyversicolorone monooxygenase